MASALHQGTHPLAAAQRLFEAAQRIRQHPDEGRMDGSLTRLHRRGPGQSFLELARCLLASALCQVRPPQKDHDLGMRRLGSTRRRFQMCSGGLPGAHAQGNLAQQPLIPG